MPQGIDSTIDDLGRRLSNWGRWGPEDELGTLNYVTQSKRLEAAGCVADGQTVSLALPLQSQWPQSAGSGRINASHVMTATGSDAIAAHEIAAYSDDAIVMSVHAHTHWDALSHVFHRGRMFNGHSAAVVTAAGARRNDIMPVVDAMVTRGVLLDLAPSGEVLPPGYEITVDDLDCALERQRVELRSGDALLLRTGHLGRIRREGRWSEFTAVGGKLPAEPGAGWPCLPWIHEQQVAAVACDNWAVEVLCGGESTRLPVHEIGIVHMGLLLGEMFDLDPLARLCERDGRWDFMLSAGPLPIVGGVGGPVNPIALR